MEQTVLRRENPDADQGRKSRDPLVRIALANENDITNTYAAGVHTNALFRKSDNAKALAFAPDYLSDKPLYLLVVALSYISLLSMIVDKVDIWALAGL